ERKAKLGLRGGVRALDAQPRIVSNDASLGRSRGIEGVRFSKEMRVPIRARTKRREPFIQPGDDGARFGGDVRDVLDESGVRRGVDVVERNDVSTVLRASGERRHSER